MKKEFSSILYKIKTKDLLFAFFAFAILQLAFWNFRPMSMGYGYAEMSVHPFDMSIGWYHKRLLMPALSYIFGFRDIHLYFIFSYILSYVFLLLIWLYVKQQFINLNNLAVFLLFFSICSLEFVSYLFFFPGYPDHLLSIFIVLAFCFSFSEESIVRLLILAIATHDISLFIFIPLLLFRLNKQNRSIAFSCIGIYGFLYLLAFRFNVHDLLDVHRVQSNSSLQWITSNPVYFICGVLVAFKILWLIIFLGLHFTKGLQKQFLFTILLVTLFTCFMGVDTSRLMSFAFPLLLLSLRTAYEKINYKLFFTIVIANLLIPYINVSLNMGIIKVVYFKDFFNWVTN